MSLTAAQKTEFAENGFLVLDRFVSESQCDQLMAEISHLVDEYDPSSYPPAVFSSKDQANDQQKLTTEYFLDSGNKIAFFFEAGAFSDDGKLKQSKALSLAKIGHALHLLNPVFREFSDRYWFRALTQELGFIKPRLIQSMYIFKQPRIGGEVICHQDATFLYTEPVSAMGFWFALQESTRENGCLYVLPGGHRIPLKRRFMRTPENNVKFEELDSSPWPQDGFIPLEVKKGSMIVLHGLLPHLSGPNLSGSSRHAYTLHVIEADAHYPTNNWLKLG